MTAVSIHETPTVLTAEIAEVLVYNSPGVSHAGWTLLGNQSIRTSRWSEHLWLVVTNAAGTFGVHYEQGLTDSQEPERPWEHVPADTEMELVPLVGAPVTTTTYLTEPDYAAYLQRQRKARQ